MKKSLLLPIALLTLTLVSCQADVGRAELNPSPADETEALITDQLEEIPVSADAVLPVPVKVDIKDTVKAEKEETVATGVPFLTQGALDVLDNPIISFSGIDEIALYSITTSRYASTTVLTTATYMDGTNWVADYLDTNTNSVQRIYYSNHEGSACQVGVSFMNEALYEPMLTDEGNEINWVDGGLYNSLSGLTVSDFSYNPNTKYFDYIGTNRSLLAKIGSMATPYEMTVDTFSLYVHEGDIVELIVKSEYDYTIAANYKAIQTMKLCINTGAAVEVPTVPSFSYEPIHDDLKIAIDNMQSLDSYTLSFHSLLGSPYASGYTEDGFVETVTPDDLYFAPVSRYASDGSGKVLALSDEVYGYHKFDENFYNAYYTSADPDGNPIVGSYTASRAYAGSIKEAAPSFAFAPEIFRSYSTGDDGSITYFVDDSMAGVARTFYNGVGNDLATYGIFATRGYTSETTSFTPFVTVKGGYITESCFYFNLGTMYGVIEIDYSDFNSSSLPPDVTIDFPRREIPTTWSELTVQVGTDETQTETVATDVFINSLFEDDTASSRVPFFGEVLGDCYGFGMNQYYKPNGLNRYVNALCMYYDVPLDSDYTINDSLRAVYLFLIQNGYTNVGNHVYTKGNITIIPVDNSLDFLIYIYKAV